MADEGSVSFAHGAAQVVETRLYFSHEMGWQLMCSFIPGTANGTIEAQFGGLVEDSSIEKRSVPDSLREAVLVLFERQVALGDAHATRSAEAFRNWVQTLGTDAELLLDDNVVVHRSPPSFESLTKLLKASPETAIVAFQMTNGGSAIDAVGWVIALGGSRLILRLVGGADAALGDFFDRVRGVSLPEYRPKRPRTIFADITEEIQFGAEATAEATVEVQPSPPRRRQSTIVN